MNTPENIGSPCNNHQPYTLREVRLRPGPLFDCKRLYQCDNSRFLLAWRAFNVYLSVVTKDSGFRICETETPEAMREYVAEHEIVNTNDANSVS